MLRRAALPAIVRHLWTLGLPLPSTDAATVSRAKQQMNVPKTHCYDAALPPHNFSSIESLPDRVLEIRPSNGRSKQRANVDRHGTHVDRPFRTNQRLPKHTRQRNPAAGHSNQRQRYGPELIDTVELKGQTGRAVIKIRGTRVALYGTKPSVSAKAELSQLAAQRPGHTIRWTTPSQHEHQGKSDTTVS